MNNRQHLLLIFFQFLVDEKTGIIRVGRTNFANKWEFNFQAVAFDLGKQSSRVPVTVEIIGKF